jgi:DNA repair protein SbcC/Rad50
MIPIKLMLKNFMSYGDPAVVVPFDGLHVACLSGDNGNGKSAILDGITWALWGKTRASSTRAANDDDLVRLGADEVEVRLEFELNNQQYRVIKKRRRGKSSGQDWQLALRKPDGAYSAIGGGGQRETGRQIVQLLSMEYETFINSAYLQQGRADEFARQTPDARKRILGEILDLDRYDRLEARAKERHRERKEQADELERQIRMLETEIARLPEYRDQLAEVVAGIATLNGQMQSQEELTAEWRARRGRYEALAEQVKQAEAQTRRIAEDLKQRDGERCGQVAKLERLGQVLAQREAITADFQALQRALKRREELEPKVEAFNVANAHLRTTIGVIDAQMQKLQGDIKFVEQGLKHAEDQERNRQLLVRQIETLTSELRAVADPAAELARAQAELEAAQQEFADLSAQNKELTATIADLDEVIALLGRPHAVCPVCESDLSGQKHALVLARQEEKKATAQRKQREVRQAGAARKQAATALQAEVQRLGTVANERVTRQTRIEDLRAQLQRMPGGTADIAALRKQAQDLRAQFEAGDFAGPQRAQRLKLEREIETLTLVKAEFETVRQQLQRLEPSRGRHQELEQAAQLWDEECRERERLEKLVAARQKELADAGTSLDKLHAEAAGYDAVVRETTGHEAELRRLQQELNGLKVREGSLLNYIGRCETATVDKKGRAEEHRKVAEESKTYLALAQAFGKKGLQSMIIENAIPEIEDEANELLARMTDNEMQVRFVTTRAAKSGSHEIETLDIQVNDDMGIRPYELFSGGEAFRINFAIRIAMSRLLARRSGAKLQTLIMDEGFGSQDGKGREKLVEVIGAIKDDFEKILVITHVEELKDAFTQRIEVTKDATGSHVHVL